MYDLIIKNGLVIDGTGGLSFQADVAVQDGFICAVGALKDAVAAQVIDAAGKVVTPGFIDGHNGSRCHHGLHRQLRPQQRAHPQLLYEHHGG